MGEGALMRILFFKGSLTWGGCERKTKVEKEGRLSSVDKTYVDAMTADISGRIFAYSIGEYEIESNWESISLQSDQDMSWCEGGKVRKE